MGLYNVLYVPEIAKNLVSVSAMTGKGAEVLFENNKCYVTKDQKTMNIGHLTNSNLYVINTEPDFANVQRPEITNMLTRYHRRKWLLV